MIFWDASAIVPLLLQEPESERMDALAAGDSVLLVWWGTRVECLSALARRHREGGLDRSGLEAARRVLRALTSAWHEIVASDLTSRPTTDIQTELLLSTMPQLSSQWAWASRS